MQTRNFLGNRWSQSKEEIALFSSINKKSILSDRTQSLKKSSPAGVDQRSNSSSI